jgi:hypothetical protein
MGKHPIGESVTRILDPDDLGAACRDEIGEDTELFDRAIAPSKPGP